MLEKMCERWRWIDKRIGKVNFFIVMTGLVIIFYNEILCYKISKKSWRTFPDSSNSSSKILFVSDPQIVGMNDEHWLYGFLARWDCDRFLYNGFKEALDHAQADVVVFLGDLFDEGNLATDYQYEGYVERFSNIFQVPSHIKTVYVPGDNDIAREGFNFIEQKKKERFDKFFPAFSNPVTSVAFVDIIKMEGYDERIDQVWLNMSRILSLPPGRIKMFCNHFGILNYLPKLHKIMKKIQPNLIIAGHEHKSEYFSCADCWNKNRKIFKHLLDDDQVKLTRNLLDDPVIYQIVIPTCSYRMGAYKMGYGFMAISYDGQMSYTVLWVPNRYQKLGIYIWFICISVIVMTLQILGRYFGNILILIFALISQILKLKK